jgi:biopolymer transport protein TolR
MAQVGTGGRGRDPNVELNLVPVIDLMSVLITFLLISAVWTQVSMIQLGASFASPRDPEQVDIKPPPIEDLVLKLEIRANGYVLFVGKEVRTLPMIDGAYDTEALIADLSKVKQMYPDKPGVKMAISDEIMYEHVVAAMDAGLKAGFSPELLTGGPN